MNSLFLRLVMVSLFAILAVGEVSIFSILEREEYEGLNFVCEKGSDVYCEETFGR